MRITVERVLRTTGLLLLFTSVLHAQREAPDTLALREDLLFASVPTVTAASRFSQEIGEAPASINVISRQEIARMGYQTLADVLTSVRGIYASGDRNYTYLGVRGFARTGNYNTRILVMVDGHRLNEPISDFMGIGFDAPVALEDVERIEIIRGPGSSLYGTNAVLAVINLVTRRPTGAGTTVHAEGGSSNTWRGHAAWDGRVGRTRILVSGGLRTSDGEDLYFPEFASAGLSDGWVTGRDGERNATGLAKAQLGEVEILAGIGHRERDVPTASFETTPHQDLSTTDRRIFSSARYEHAAANLGRLSLRAAADYYRYEGTYPFDGVPFDDYQTSTWFTTEGQYVRPVGRHRLMAGAELRHVSDMSQGAVDGGEEAWDETYTATVAAVFLQDEIRFGRALVSLGLRHDYYSTVGGTTNPRAALIVPLSGQTTVKLLAGRAFRAPNILELYYYGEHDPDRDAVLDPEHLSTAELVVEQGIGSRARLTASVYRLAFRDVLVLRTEPESGELAYTNDGKADGHGLELELEGRWRSLDARVSYAYQRVSESGMAGDPPNAPRHLGRIGGTYTLHPRASVGLELRGVSDRLGQTGQRVPGYMISNARLVVRPAGDRMNIQISGTNLLDHRYSDPGGEEHRQVAIPQPRRTLRVGLHVRM